jgi:inhibitor of KinA sporulation pathway (predicted exonuclease)
MFFPFGETSLNTKELINEIIQIGAVQLDSDFKELSRFSTFIRPKIHRVLHPRVRKMTKISPQQLKRGIPFTEAMDQFSKWMGHDYIICTWGIDDLRILQENVNFFHHPGIRLDRAINLQAVYQEIHKLKNASALNQVIEQLGLELNQEFHDALNDAVYTVNVLRTLPPEQLKTFSFITYLEQREQLKDKEKELVEAFSLQCPKCHQPMVRKKTQLIMKHFYHIVTHCEQCNVSVWNKLRVSAKNEKRPYTITEIKTVEPITVPPQF